MPEMLFESRVIWILIIALFVYIILVGSRLWKIFSIVFHLIRTKDRTADALQDELKTSLRCCSREKQCPKNFDT